MRAHIRPIPSLSGVSVGVDAKVFVSCSMIHRLDRPPATSRPLSKARYGSGECDGCVEGWGRFCLPWRNQNNPFGVLIYSVNVKVLWDSGWCVFSPA